MNNQNENKNNLGKDTLKQADNFIGNKLALASNKLVPVVAPIITKILWKHKEKILLFFIVIMCFGCFGIQSIAYQMAVDARSFLEQIPEDHKQCMESAKTKYGVELELLASFSQVISEFKADHKSSGKGFLEIPDDYWVTHGADGNDNGSISESDLCDNYFTLANKLSSLSGSAEEKIDKYNHSKREQIKTVYNLLTGLIFIPYGNPIGLTRSDLANVTSGYNDTRNIGGNVDVHWGVDIVPSSVWYQENPGKGTEEAINRSILIGKVYNFVDEYIVQGVAYHALCSYVSNTYYRTLYCHCAEFLAENESTLSYGDPVCRLGSTGYVTGPHNHVEIYRKNNAGTWDRLDPTPFLFPN